MITAAFVITLSFIAPALAVNLDQMLPGRDRTLREFATSRPSDSPWTEMELRRELARFGLTLGMDETTLARYEANPADPVFAPLRSIIRQSELNVNVDKALSRLEEGGVFLVFDFERTMARERRAPIQGRFFRFPGLGPRTFEAIEGILRGRGWTGEPRLDLTLIDSAIYTPRWLQQRDLYGVVTEQQILRAGLRLQEVLDLGEELRKCGQLLTVDR